MLTPLSALCEQDEREKDPAFVSDAYAECYPAFHEFGTTVVDSDEEDMSHMDKKGVSSSGSALKTNIFHRCRDGLVLPVLSHTLRLLSSCPTCPHRLAIETPLGSASTTVRVA